MNFWLFI